MPDDYVTLPPMRRKEVEKLAALCEREGRPGSPAVSPFVAEILASAAPLLRSALEEPGEVRREYRVVSDFAPGDCSITLLRPDDIDGGERMFLEAAASYRDGGVYANPRVQHRTVAETPWRDLEEGERDG